MDEGSVGASGPGGATGLRGRFCCRRVRFSPVGDSSDRDGDDGHYGQADQYRQAGIPYSVSLGEVPQALT